ncbi:hypothetical protein [Roseibium sp.]|uniref:hypothetical protein n=1 Tax=Roseibium sp. TaxID=1936156 RepID=UPI003265D824
MATRSDGAPDFRVQGINGIRGVDQLAHLRRVIEKRDDLVPGPPPTRRDCRIPLGQFAALELCQDQLGDVSINRRVDRL